MPDQALEAVTDPTARFEAILKASEVAENPPETADEPESSADDSDAQEGAEVETDAESEDQPAEVEDEATEEGEEVEFEGKTYKVPKELKGALLKNADYTRKTQEVAERRRQLEEREAYLAAVEQVRSEAFDKAAELRSIDATLKQFEQIDWNAVADQDATQFLKLDRQYRQVQAKRQELVGELQAIQGHIQQQEQARVRKLLEDGQKELTRRIPGFNAETSKKLLTDARSYGFEESELRAVIDPRMVHVLHDAIKYRELQDGKTAAQKKVVQAKPMQAAARTSTTQQVKTQEKQLMDRLKKTGSGDVATEILRRRLEASQRKR